LACGKVTLGGVDNTLLELYRQAKLGEPGYPNGEVTTTNTTWDLETKPNKEEPDIVKIKGLKGGEATLTFTHDKSGATSKIKVVVVDIKVVPGKKYIPLFNDPLNTEKTPVTIICEPSGISGTLTLSTSNKIGLFASSNGSGQGNNTLSWTSSGEKTAHMQGNSVSANVNGENLTATFTVDGNSFTYPESTQPPVQAVVCSVDISSLSRWTGKGKQNDLSLIYKPIDLDKDDISLSGGTGTFGFFEMKTNPNTGQLEEVIRRQRVGRCPERETKQATFHSSPRVWLRDRRCRTI